MRKLPELSTASGGTSRGRALVRVVRADIISSVSWEQVEVGASWRDWMAGTGTGDNDAEIDPLPIMYWSS